MSYVITEACIDVKNRCCTDECAVDCVYEGDLPEAMRGFRAANAAFFDSLGMPGGAARVGSIARDADFVVYYPSAR